MLYSLPIKTLAACDGRYPSAEEERVVLDWAASVPKRLQAANLLAQKEAQIVREAIEQVKPRYPRFAPQHDRAWEKAARDMSLALRYAIHGMVLGDADAPNEKVFVWLCTIVRGTGHTPQLFRDVYGAVVAAAGRHLPPDLFDRARPHLERMAADLSNFAEPVLQAVN